MTMIAPHISFVLVTILKKTRNHDGSLIKLHQSQSGLDCASFPSLISPIKRERANKLLVVGCVVHDLALHNSPCVMLREDMI